MTAIVSRDTAVTLRHRDFNFKIIWRTIKNFNGSILSDITINDILAILLLNIITFKNYILS